MEGGKIGNEFQTFSLPFSPPSLICKEREGGTASLSLSLPPFPSPFVGIDKNIGGERMGPRGKGFPPSYFSGLEGGKCSSHAMYRVWWKREEVLAAWQESA